MFFTKFMKNIYLLMCFANKVKFIGNELRSENSDVRKEKNMAPMIVIS